MSADIYSFKNVNIHFSFLYAKYILNILYFFILMYILSVFHHLCLVAGLLVKENKTYKFVFDNTLHSVFLFLSVLC